MSPAFLSPRLSRYICGAAILCQLVVFAVLLHYVWHRLSAGHFGDFQHFYTAAQALRDGVSPYGVTAPGFLHPGYIYPPLIAFLYVPLTYLGDAVSAAHVSLLINILALAAGLWIGAQAMLERFERGTPSERRGYLLAVITCVALLLSLDKAKGELQMLQTNAFIFTAFMIALWLLDRSSIGVGAALGFAINIKYQAIVMFPYLLLRRRWAAAGWTAAWSAFWAMLPGVMIGFGTEMRYLGVAFGGVLQLVGLKSAGKVGDTATIEALGSGLSISIPSAITRLLATGSHAAPLILTALMGMGWIGLLAVAYRASDVPWLRWPIPAHGGQRKAPWCGWVAIEWMILIVTVLAFSPQTNTRHLVLMMAVDLGALALVVSGPRTPRALVPVLLGILVIWGGLNLPPGHRTQTTTATGQLLEDTESPTVAHWHRIGGPSWAILAGMLLIAWGGLRRGGREVQGRVEGEERTTSATQTGGGPLGAESTPNLRASGATD
jgi:hypothetical protein